MSTLLEWVSIGFGAALHATFATLAMVALAIDAMAGRFLAALVSLPLSAESTAWDYSRISRRHHETAEHASRPRTVAKRLQTQLPEGDRVQRQYDDGSRRISASVRRRHRYIRGELATAAQPQIATLTEERPSTFNRSSSTPARSTSVAG